MKPLIFIGVWGAVIAYSMEENSNQEVRIILIVLTLVLSYTEIVRHEIINTINKRKQENEIST